MLKLTCDKFLFAIKGNEMFYHIKRTITRKKEYGNNFQAVLFWWLLHVYCIANNNHLTAVCPGQPG